MNDEPMVPLATFNAYDQGDIDKLAHAGGYLMILWEIEQRLRVDSKCDKLSEPVIEYIEKFRDEIASMKSDYHLPE